MRRHALIVGAAGFIGSACVDAFLAAGWRVTALRHRRPVPPRPDLETVAVETADPTVLARVLAARGPAEALVNCAGRASDVGPWESFAAANLRLVEGLVAAIRAGAARRLIHVSTTDVYGLRDFRQADEDTPRLASPRDPYPYSKLLAERAIECGLPPAAWALLRPAAVWGPGDRSILPRVLDFLASSPAIVHFGPWRGANRWPLAHVTHVAAAAVAVAVDEEPGGTIHHVIDPERTSIDAFYARVRWFLLGRHDRPARLCLPLAWGRGIGRLAEELTRGLRRDQPLFEPTWYAVRSVAADLDFSSTRLAALFRRHNLCFGDAQRHWRALAADLAGAIPLDGPAAGQRAHCARNAIPGC